MQEISWQSLAWCALPVLIVSAIYLRWQGNPAKILLSGARMVLQLTAVGYVLVALFSNPSPWLTLLVMAIMISAASWIAIGSVGHQRAFLLPVFSALLISVAFHLFLSVKIVLSVEHWYDPRLMIPLAGMYFSNTMNALSLAAERYHSELQDAKPAKEARITAFHAAMIPQMNAMLAVGLVSLPGMMTGQILSGISPLIAVRYQIMIMTMMLGASGLGVVLMLWQLGRHHIAEHVTSTTGSKPSSH